jgi:hypothetical protein
VAGSGSLFQCSNLGMIEPVIEVRAFPDDLAIPHQHAADLRIGRRLSDRRFRERQRSPHEEFVCRCHSTSFAEITPPTQQDAAAKQLKAMERQEG